MKLSELIEAAKLLVDAPKDRAFCEYCGAVYGEQEQEFDFETESFKHRCDIEERTSAFMRASSLYFITGKSPRSRARGYGVQ